MFEYRRVHPKYLPIASQVYPNYLQDIPIRPAQTDTTLEKLGNMGNFNTSKKRPGFTLLKTGIWGDLFFSISFCSNLRPSALARAQSSRLLRIMSRRTLSGREVQTSVRPGYLADLAFEMGMGQVSSPKTIEN